MRKVVKSHEYERQFQTHSGRLFNAGYEGEPGLDLLITTAARIAGRQIDPNRPYYVARRGDTSETALEAEPYTVDWLILSPSYLVRSYYEEGEAFI